MNVDEWTGVTAESAVLEGNGASTPLMPDTASPSTGFRVVYMGE